MKIIKRINDNAVLFTGNDISLDGFVKGNDWEARSFTSETVTLDDAELPDDYVSGGAWAFDGTWSILDQSAVDVKRAEIRDNLASQVREIGKEKRNGGTTVNGLLINTDADARSLLLASKVNSKASRKIVTKGGKAKLTGAQMIALVEAVDDFVQSVMDREYDLLAEIDAAAYADLGTIDINSGWPAQA